MARLFSSLLAFACLVILPTSVQADGAAKPKKDLSPKQLQSMADIAAGKGDFKTAMKYYKKLIKAAPSQLAYYKRSQANVKRREFGKAVNDLGKAVELDPKFWKGYVTRAKINMQIGECSKAQEDVVFVIEKKPKNKQAAKLKPQIEDCIKHLAEAEIHEQRGDLNGAKSSYEEALTVAYESHKIILKKASILMQLGDHQSVLVDTMGILKADKNNMDAMAVRAEAFYREGEHDVALTHYKEGLRLDPEHKELKSNYNRLRKMIKLKQEADRLSDEKQYVECGKVLEELVTIDPSNRNYNVQIWIAACRTYNAHADSLMDEERKAAAEEGLRACNVAINLDAQRGEKNVDAYIERGEANLRAEKWQEAINDMTQATQIDDSSQQARDGLHKAQVEQKKADRKDYYKILGVPRNADDRQIKKAFRKLAVLHHPDKHKGEKAKEEAELKFKDIVEAHDILSDEEARGKYDRGEDLEVPKQRGNRNFHFGGGRPFHFNFG